MKSALLTLTTILLIASAGRAQTPQDALLAANLPMPEALPSDHHEVFSPVVASVANGAPKATPDWQMKLERWVDFKEVSFSGRYRNLAGSSGFRDFDNGQQRSVVDGAFKFDQQGRYAVHFHVSSGRTFNWAYTDQIGDDFLKRINSLGNVEALSPVLLQDLIASEIADPVGAGFTAHVGSRGFEMYFRQLFFSATPIKQISLEYGSLGIDRGVNTEATTYDDDGYISGERVRFHNPERLYFDEISFTNAYEGDILEPNFFARGGSLTQANYRQVLLAKSVSDRFKASADYTFDKATHTVHEAGLAKLPEARVIDTARVELYQRLNDHVLQGLNFQSGAGVAITGSKTLAKRFQLDGGYAKIDNDYGVLTGYRFVAAAGFSMNGDSYLTGERFFTRARIRASDGVELFGSYTHQIRIPDSVYFFNKQGITGGMTVDFSRMIFSSKPSR